MIAAKRLLTLGGKIEGEIPVLRVWDEGELVKLALPLGPDTLPAGLQSMFWDSREGHSLVFPVEESSSSERIYSVQRNFGKQVNKGDKSLVVRLDWGSPAGFQSERRLRSIPE